MKKEKTTSAKAMADNAKKGYCDQGFREVFQEISQRVKAGADKTKEYAQKNPQKTKTILAGVGAVFLALLVFLVGKKRNKKDE